MLFVRREPDDITGPDLLDGAAFALSPATSGSDDQGLAQWVCMPSCPCAGFEGHTGALHVCWIRRLKQRIDTYTASEPLRRSYCRGLRTYSFDFHVCTPSTSLRTEQGFDGPALVHCTVSFCHLIER